MSSVSDKQSSTEVALEAEDVRAGLAHTLDQLRENLKPEHVAEEVVSNARLGASTIADGVYGLAREHPIPALLIGAGCAMIFGFGARAASQKQAVLDLRPSGRSSPRGPAYFDDPAHLHPVPIEAPTSARPNVRWPASRFRIDAASSLSRNGRSREANPGLFDTPPAAAVSTMSTVSRTFPRSRKQTQSQLAGLLQDQPLILAALGVAVGAAIGAALPITDVEDEWMGGTSSSLRHAAEDVARSEIDELKDVASRTAENLKQSAADHGLSADNLNDLMRDAGEHAKTAIHEVGGGHEPDDKAG